MTALENSRNISASRKDAGSPYLGVGWHKGRGKWQASIRVKGKLHYLGLHDTAEAANLARVNAEVDLWGLNPRRALFVNTHRTKRLTAAGWEV